MSRVPFVLWRKETSLALRSCATWIVFAAVAGLAGVLFVWGLRESAGRVAQLPAVFCAQISVVAPFAAAFFTMGLFARERASGSLEALLTAPVTDAEVVAGKFLSAFTLVLLSLAFASLSLPVYLRLASAQAFVPAHVADGLAAVALASAAWTAFGVMAAAAARREASAGVATLVVCLPAGLLSAGAFPWIPADGVAVLSGVAGFARGVADTRPVVLLATCTLFFLFCATRVLETRRWASSS